MSNTTVTITASVKGNTKIYVGGKYLRTVNGDASVVDVITTVERELTMNLQTHTGMVHAPGRFDTSIRGNAPKCCASASAVSRYHYLAPVTGEVTCRRCIAALAKNPG
jgi:hypothetical protein